MKACQRELAAFEIHKPEAFKLRAFYYLEPSER